MNFLKDKILFTEGFLSVNADSLTQIKFYLLQSQKALTKYRS